MPVESPREPTALVSLPDCDQVDIADWFSRRDKAKQVASHATVVPDDQGGVPELPDKHRMVEGMSSVASLELGQVGKDFVVVLDRTRLDRHRHSRS
jgi:hypothetical protein